MNIIFRELRANFRSLIIWSVIVILFVVMGLSKFSAYYNNPDMLTILDNLPKAVLDAFNMQAFNLTTIIGFFGLMYTYFAILLCIAAVMWGSDTIVKEERDKTVEFSLTLPVTRSHVVTAKTIAAVVNCIGLLLVTWGISLVSAARYHPQSEFYGFLSLCMLALFILQLTFLSIGIFLGSSMKRYKLAGSAAVSVLLGTYFISVVSALSDKLGFLKYFTPFKYFDAAAMLRDSTIDIVFVCLAGVIILICMAGAYRNYAKRDLFI